MVNPPGFREFVALMALSMSLVALSIDAMLPGLAEIAADLSVENKNDRQLVITVLFLGMSLGMLIYGPVSDAIGRRPPMFVGFGLFIVASIVAAFAPSYEVLLAARFVQGFGAASPRIVTIAIIRDGAAGREMARVMSLVMMIFILVPTIAPALGQVILLVSNWRMIFVALVIVACITFFWFWARQPETLLAEKRRPFTFARISGALLEILRNREAVVYTIAAGLVFGAFMGFLNSSQQILQELYGLGSHFPFYFAILALTIGVSSWVNSRLVVRFGMRLLSRIALAVLMVSSALFLMFCLYTHPSLLVAMLYLMLSFFFTGILFGNLNSLAMEPLGHIAGMASSVIGSVTTLISLILGYFIGAAYNDSLIPLVAGYGVLSAGSLLLFQLVRDDQALSANAS